MAAASNPHPDDHTVFTRVSAQDRRPALSVLLTGRRGADDAAVAPFEAFARDNRLDLRHLWTVSDGKRDVAAVLIVPGVGRTAMLFLSPLPSAGGGRLALAGRLIARALAELDPAKIRLVQALLEQGQPLQRRAIEAGGFRFLSDLAYMHRVGKAVLNLPPIRLEGRTLDATHWSEGARPLFARAIADSYRDTLDCPGLLGLREMDDILAGHMATGRFNPKHWTVWHDGDTPAAVPAAGRIQRGGGASSWSTWACAPTPGGAGCRATSCSTRCTPPRSAARCRGPTPRCSWPSTTATSRRCACTAGWVSAPASARRR